MSLLTLKIAKVLLPTPKIKICKQISLLASKTNKILSSVFKVSKMLSSAAKERKNGIFVASNWKTKKTNVAFGFKIAQYFFIF